MKQSQRDPTSGVVDGSTTTGAISVFSDGSKMTGESRSTLRTG
jgi:hypothetical protein